MHKLLFKRLSVIQYKHLISGHLHLLIVLSSGSSNVPRPEQSDTQFPKSKYFESLHVKQLLFMLVGTLLHVLQLS